MYTFRVSQNILKRHTSFFQFMSGTRAYDHVYLFKINSGEVFIHCGKISMPIRLVSNVKNEEVENMIIWRHKHWYTPDTIKCQQMQKRFCDDWTFVTLRRTILEPSSRNVNCVYLFLKVFRYSFSWSPVYYRDYLYYIWNRESPPNVFSNISK